MNVMVTGATGFVGSYVCQALLQRNVDVYALSHSGDNTRVASLLNNPDFHLLNGDVRSLPQMQEIMKNNRIDAVIHLAATPSHGPKEVDYNITHFEVNALGTLNILHSCLLTGVSRVIYASAMGVYGKPEYLPVDENHPKKPVEFISLTKLHGENYCEFYAQNYGLHTIVLRYSGVYGPRKIKGIAYNFILASMEGKSFQISGDGNQTRDFVYIGDVVNATMKALDMVDRITFDVFNIGCGQETSVNTIAAGVVKATGNNTDFRYSPASSDDRFVLDIAKARRVLGYQPRSLENALAEFASFLKGTH